VFIYCQFNFGNFEAQTLNFLVSYFIFEEINSWPHFVLPQTCPTQPNPDFEGSLVSFSMNAWPPLVLISLLFGEVLSIKPLGRSCLSCSAPTFTSCPWKRWLFSRIHEDSQTYHKTVGSTALRAREFHHVSVGSTNAHTFVCWQDRRMTGHDLDGQIIYDAAMRGNVQHTNHWFFQLLAIDETSKSSQA